ncbi:MAG TPA: alpha/beta fold hydrolase [Gemmatimonadales bacterium]|nr:alpha/beta fold hydrolase [Gemmatimonadales bacterium]
MVTPTEFTVFPDDCDASGKLTIRSLLRLLERARWEQLGRAWPVGPAAPVSLVVRKLTVEVHAHVTAGDRLRVETSLLAVGRTSVALRQVARTADGAVGAVAESTFDCLTRAGEPAPLPSEMIQVLGPRPSVRASETRHLAVRGLALALDVQGDGKPILFIHGFPLDRTVWRQVIATLTGWKRVAPDLRGMGLSDAPGSYSMTEYADDLAALLDALHVEQAIVCGLSMGGYVAFEMMRRHKARVRALVLVNTRAEAETEEGKQKRNETISLVEREGLTALADRLVPQLLAPWSVTTQPQVVEHLKAMIAGSPPAGIIGAIQAMRDRPDSTALLPQIDVPTLVIAGREDRLIPPAASRALADAIPGAQLTLIPEAGHLTPLEQPVQTSRVIGEFLESID